MRARGRSAGGFLIRSGIGLSRAATEETSTSTREHVSPGLASRDIGLGLRLGLAFEVRVITVR